MLQKCKVETNDKSGSLLTTSGGVQVCQSVKKMKDRIEKEANEAREKITEALKLKELEEATRKAQEIGDVVDSKVDKAIDKIDGITSAIQEQVQQITSEIEKATGAIASIPDILANIENITTGALGDIVEKGEEVLNDISNEILKPITTSRSIVLDEKNKVLFSTNPLTGIVEKIEFNAKETLERIIQSADEFEGIWGKYVGLPVLYDGVKTGSIAEGVASLALFRNILKDCGVSLEKLEQLKNTADIVKMGTEILFTENCTGLLPCDIICWSAIGKNNTIGHIGIYIGEGNVIHAPRVGQVVKVQKIWNTKDQKVLKVVRPLK